MKHSIVSGNLHLVAIAGIVLALAGSASANGKGQQPHKAKKGIVNTEVATEVGGVTLQPGEYEVKEVKSNHGPLLRFTKVTENYQATEGLPVYDREVVAEVQCTEQPLAAEPARTGFFLASDTGKAIGLEIRGSNVKYLFGSTASDEQSGASAQSY